MAEERSSAEARGAETRGPGGEARGATGRAAEGLSDNGEEPLAAVLSRDSSGARAAAAVPTGRPLQW